MKTLDREGETKTDRKTRRGVSKLVFGLVTAFLLVVFSAGSVLGAMRVHDLDDQVKDLKGQVADVRDSSADSGDVYDLTDRVDQLETDLSDVKDQQDALMFDLSR
jgi:cell division protein FtsB